MSRNVSTFERSASRYKQQPTVLILCEDSQSCLTYLEDASNFYRSFAQVMIAHCDHTDPKGIVLHAIKQTKKFEQIYCVIDRDRHDNFKAAIQLAKKHAPQIKIIVSYPCYEFWLLLHFHKTRKCYVATGNKSPCEMVVKDLKKNPLMKNYDKGSSKDVFKMLLGKLPEAQKRSKEVYKAALDEGEMNPSSCLHELITIFETLGKLQTV